MSRVKRKTFDRATAGRTTGGRTTTGRPTTVHLADHRRPALPLRPAHGASASAAARRGPAAASPAVSSWNFLSRFRASARR